MTDAADDRNHSMFWQQMLTGEHPSLRRGRKMMRLITPTAGERCRLCCVGFDGFTAPALRRIRSATRPIPEASSSAVASSTTMSCSSCPSSS